MTQPYNLNKNVAPAQQNNTSELLRVSQSLEFHSSLENYEPTPLLELKRLAKNLKVQNIYVKDEASRFGLNAFKGLGASYAIHKLLEKDPDITTFCTTTDGNHGRAVAWAAELFGKKARVFVPKETTRPRIEAIEAQGAIVKQLPMNYDDACAHAAEMSRAHGWCLVQDTAWEGYEEIPALIKAGYITQFKELEESVHTLPEAQVDVVFLQAGVGSWPAAAVWYYSNRYGKAAPKIVLVEPRESSGILESFRKSKRTYPSGKNGSIMAGLNCGIPSLSAWEILKVTVDAAMEIEDSFAQAAIKKLYYPEGEDPQIIAGESGVGGIAGLIALTTDPRFEDLKKELKISRDSRILIYNSEGATDPENFKRIIQKK